jgi:hypothetical protein
VAVNSSVSFQSANENKENIKECLSLPSVTLTRIECNPSKTACDTTTPTDEQMPSCSRLHETSVTVDSSMTVEKSADDMAPCSSVSSSPSCAGQLLSHQQQQTDYMGLALKQWSMYLGNVLLNFIHKECKNNNGNERDQCGLSTGVSSAVEQLHQQQLSNLAVAVGSRAGSNFFQAAVAAAASNSGGASCSQSQINVSPNSAKRSKKSSSTPLAADSAQVQNSEIETNLIGDATTVISQGYCPCCHYHSHLQQQQLQQQQQQQQQQTSTINQQQHVMLAAAAVAAQQQQQQQQQQQHSQQTQSFHQGYYNYAANFSPYFSSQRHYVSY